MRTRIFTIWLPTAGLLMLWLAAWIWCGGLEALIAATGLRARAALLSLALVALALALVNILVASRRSHVTPALGLVVLGAALQAASALAARARPGQRSAMPPDMRLLLISACVTLLLFSAMILTARAAFPPAERPAPLRARLRSALRAATGIGPRALLFGPIFQKEVRVGGRRWFTYIARALYPLVLLAVASIAYYGLTAEVEDRGEGGGAQRLEALQRFAPILAVAVGWCQLAALLFIAPLLTAPAICEERRALTLPALMTTPLSSAQIIFGKLSSRVVQLVILALIATPLLLAIRIFGGLDAEIIVATTAITLSAATLAASLGLMYSVWHRRAATAAIFAMLSMGVFVLVVVVIFLVTALRTNLPPQGWVFGVSAPMSMVALTMAIVSPWPGLDTGSFITQVWVSNTLINLALSVLICAYATFALRRSIRAELAGALTEREVRRARPKRGAAPADAANEQDKAAQKGAAGAARLVGDRPVLWREVRQSTLGSRRRLIILTATVALGLGWLYARVGMHDEITHGAVAIIGMLVVCLSAALAATSSVAAERESRTWDVLMTTPLRPGQILGGKYLGALRRQWVAPAWMGGHFLFAVLMGAVHPAYLLHLGLVVAGWSLFLTGTGLLFGSLLRRSTAAAVCNLALALGLCAVTPIAISIAEETLRPFRDLFNDLFDLAMWINPIAMPMVALQPATERAGGAAASLSYSMPQSHVPFWTYTTRLAAASGLGVLLGLGSLLLSIALFPRISSRAS